MAALAVSTGVAAIDSMPLRAIDGPDGFRIDGPAEDAYFGIPVRGIGDFNGDGRDDFAATGNGYTYVVFGRSGPFPHPFDVAALQPGEGMRIGWGYTGGGLQIDVAGRIDLNDDGFDDLVIGIANLDRACAVFGRPAPPATMTLPAGNGLDGFCMTGTGLYDNFGRTVAGLGDFNGDGIDDMAVAAPFADRSAAETEIGRVYVVFGRTTPFPPSIDPASLDGTFGFTLEGVAANEELGYTLAGGDVNGDGLADLLSGDPRRNPPLRGSISVLYGAPGPWGAPGPVGTLDGTSGFMLAGAHDYGWLGDRAFGTGDVNADGRVDIVAGALFAGLTSAGTGHVLHGREAFAAAVQASAFDGVSGFSIEGLRAFDRLGEGAAFVGDLNGDGVGDYAFGAPYADPSDKASAGSVYIGFGVAGAQQRLRPASALVARSGFRLDGPEASSYCGLSVDAAGDVNGDGIDDFIAGCHYASGGGSHRGEVYVLYGNAAPLAAAPAAPAASQLEDAEPTVFALATLAQGLYLDAQPFAGAAITANPPTSALGHWEYRTGPAAAFGPLPAQLGPLNALVLAPDAALRFVAAPEAHGGSPALALRFWDGGGNAAPGIGRDVSGDIGSFGGFAADDQVVAAGVVVASVNDAPDFTATDPPDVLVDSGLHEIHGWATPTTMGPANEAQQVAQAFVVAGVTDPSLFAVGPEVVVDDGTGTLRFQPAAGRYGRAEFTVRLRDDGGTANGGVDLSAPRTFAIVVARPDPLFGDQFE